MFNSRCVRQISNLSNDDSKYKFDKPTFNPEALRNDLLLEYDGRIERDENNLGAKIARVNS